MRFSGGALNASAQIFIIPKGVKMSLWKQFKTESKLEIEGIAVHPAEPNDDGTIPTFILRRIGGANFQQIKVRETIVRPYLREIEAGTLSPETNLRLNIEIFCKGNLAGWTDVQDENGNRILFNYENAFKLLTDLPDLYLTLAFEATKIANYQTVEKEIAEKNS